jgi:hypothetical protein
MQKAHADESAAALHELSRWNWAAGAPVALFYLEDLREALGYIHRKGV